MKIDTCDTSHNFIEAGDCKSGEVYHSQGKFFLAIEQNPIKKLASKHNRYFIDLGNGELCRFSNNFQMALAQNAILVTGEY
jgi:hypothetical protein